MTSDLPLADKAGQATLDAITVEIYKWFSKQRNPGKGNADLFRRPPLSLAIGTDRGLQNRLRLTLATVSLASISVVRYTYRYEKAAQNILTPKRLAIKNPVSPVDEHLSPFPHRCPAQCARHHGHNGSRKNPVRKASA